jgi:PAS domain S-box-containing protein
MEEALAECEARFRGVFENAATGISIADLGGGCVACNPAYAAMLGFRPDELVGKTLSDLVHPDDRAAVLSRISGLVAGETPAFEIDCRSLTRNGEGLWIRKHVLLLTDARGRPTHFIALVTDISERKRYKAHLQTLLNELNHRAKNLLAMIQSVARQTAARSPSEFLPRFEQRLSAISAAQDLIVRNEWREVLIEDLLRSQLACFESLSEQVLATGPRVAVTASAAQMLGMAFHELATNAAKYGALSNPHGRIDVAWSVEPDQSGQDVFALEWRESGGPRVDPPLRRGFGATLVERLTRAAFGGEVDYRFSETGVSWRMRSRASNIMSNARAAEGREARPRPFRSS